MRLQLELPLHEALEYLFGRCCLEQHPRQPHSDNRELPTTEALCLLVRARQWVKNQKITINYQRARFIMN